MKVSPSDITDLLKFHFKSKRPLLLSGAAGLGKTSIVKQFAKDAGVNIYEYRAAYAEAGDLKGLCNPEDGLMKFLRPEDLPPESDENCILFFDEINRASTSVMNCILQASDGSNKIATHKLPKGCLVVAAVNPDDANHSVNWMDFALINRFNIVSVDYDLKALIAYAKKAQWHQNVISFMTMESAIFVQNGDFDGQSNKATPRSLEYMSDMEKAGIAENKMAHKATACGLLGETLGQQYYAMASGSLPLTWADIQAKGKKTTDTAKLWSTVGAVRADLLSASNDLILDTMKAKTATSAEVKKVVEYLMVIPTDISAAFLKRLITETPAYLPVFQEETGLMERLSSLTAA